MAAAPTLDPEVLARLLFLQSTATLLPDPTSVIGFVRRGLEQVPGVQRVTYEAHGAGLASQGRCQPFPLRVAGQSHGTLLVGLADPEQFRPYAPHVGNLTALIAVVLEERRLRALHDAAARAREARAEESLRESEGRYRRLAQNLPDMIWRTDPTGKVLFVNDAVEQFLGYAPEEVLNSPMSAYFPPSSMERVMAWSRSVIKDEAGRAQIIGDVEYLHRDGHRVPGELHAALVFDENGRVVALEGVTRDITERKRAEKEREQLEERLRAAQKMEAIGRLAGGVAHDFNNLLSVILSYAEFAREALRPEDPLSEDIEEIRKAGQRAAELTRQLLAFSRKQVLAPKVINLNQVAADLEKMLRRLIGEDIDLVLVHAPDLGLVKADPGQLQQVIMNLVLNARDAMPSGGTLTIETASAELDEEYAARHVTLKPGAYVLLAIRDTGGGMDAATQGRLFEPFFTTKERGKGTGLGLSTAYGIIKQSGGDIIVRSEVGKGTTVEVYLPRATEGSAPTSGSDTSERPLIGTETIVLVEDETAVRNLTVRILSAAGYTVLAAADGGEALRVFERHTGAVQLLVTDVVMPHMGGRELVERLRGVRPDLRVLYMSGYPDSAVLRNGVLAPGTMFIGKPFAAPDFLRKVREVLDG